VLSKTVLALAAGVAATLAATAPAATSSLAAAAPATGPGSSTQPAARAHAFEPPEMTPLVQAKLAAAPAVAQTGGSDGTSAHYASTAAAAARIPQAPGSPTWRSVGPRAITAPPDYSQNGEGFAPVSGNATALTVDPSDPTGNTVYQGNYGGLWKSTNGGASWRNVTDGFVGRSPIGAVAVDPLNPRDVYIGTGIAFLSTDFGGSGVYVSHDAGRTWSRPSANVSGYGVIALAVSRAGVFVGTTDGLFRSTDAGASFSDVQLPTNAAHTGRGPEPFGSWVTAVVVKPGTPNEITAAVGFPAGTYKGYSLGNGLYRSTSGGARGSWKFLAGTSGLQSPEASTDNYIGRVSLAYGTNPDDHDVLWALVGDAGLLVGDGTKGLPTADVPLLGTASNLNGAFRSSDDGATWTTKGDVSTFGAAPNSTIASLTPLGYGPGVQSWYNNWIQVDPTDPNRVFVGLEEVYESVANAGTAAGPASWKVIERYADLCGFLSYEQGITNGAACPDQTPLYGGLSTHPDQHSIAALKTAAGTTRLYTGNDGGVFRQDAHAPAPGSTVPSTSTPGTDFDNSSWTSLNTPATTLAYHATRLPDGSTIAGLQDNGSTKTTPSGQSLEICGGDGFDVGATHNPLVFYCSYTNDKMYVTTDGGKNITDIDPDLTGAAFSAPFSVDPTDDNHLLAAGQDVKVDTVGPSVKVVKDPVLGTVLSDGWVTVFDAGTSPTGGAWSASATALHGASSYVGFCGTCQALAGPAKDRALIATNVKPGCAATKGTGACWHKAAGIGLPHEQITGIAIDPKDARTIFVTVSPGAAEASPLLQNVPRVLVSHDAGGHFTDLSGNLPHSGANAVVLRGGRLYAATEEGVFVAGTGGGTWQRFGALPKVSVTDLRSDLTGRYLTAATYGRGVFVADLKAAAASGPTPTGAGPGTSSANGSLPTTGLPLPLAGTGLVLLALAGAARRARRS
jgi:hypothetical protein